MPDNSPLCSRPTTTKFAHGPETAIIAFFLKFQVHLLQVVALTTLALLLAAGLVNVL